MTDNRIGEWLFRVENSEGADDARVKCLNWVAEQNRQVYDAFNQRSHCPRTGWQAWLDRRSV